MYSVSFSICSDTELTNSMHRCTGSDTVLSIFEINSVLLLAVNNFELYWYFATLINIQFGPPTLPVLEHVNGEDAPNTFYQFCLVGVFFYLLSKKDLINRNNM